MNFAEEYGRRKEEFETYLHTLVNGLRAYPESLREAVAYSLQNGGKRLRPILLLEATRMFGGRVDVSAIRFALAVECIHTYSLIHDDLPCMDNDDFRRGQPTCHKKFGEANAVLAGDALLNLAYELILSAIELGNGKDHYIKAGSVLSHAAGGDGLIGGQVCDLAPIRFAQDIDYIYENKTGALIVAAVKAGALLAGAGDKQLQSAEAFGELFGYCFQLRDDLLDQDSDTADKNTYFNVYGKEKTESALREKTEAALQILQTMENAEFLTELTENFMIRTE